MTQSENDPVAALLEEPAATHHRAYRITDGTDEDWASWYADWLLTLSELPQLLGALLDGGARPFGIGGPNQGRPAPWRGGGVDDLVLQR
jgi:hypothetical protein